MAQGDILGFIKNRSNNLLINGLTEIRQRSSVGVPMDNLYNYRVHDRFVTRVSDIGDFNTRIQSSALLTDLNGVAQEAMNIVTNAANTNAQVFIQQRIESLNAQSLANKKGSFSFEFLNRGFTDVAVNVYYPTVIDNHATQVLISSKSETFIIDTQTKKFKFENISVPVEAKNGLSIEIIIDGIVIGADWDNPFSKFMFNEGPVVAEFERAGNNISNEIQLCQRYFEKSYRLSDSVGTLNNAGVHTSVANASGFLQLNMYFATPKRVIPVGLFFSPVTGASGVIHRSTSGDLAALPSFTGINKLAFNDTSGWPSTQRMTNHWTADAEL